jgi:hypothetical protein
MKKKTNRNNNKNKKSKIKSQNRDLKPKKNPKGGIHGEDPPILIKDWMH